MEIVTEIPRKEPIIHKLEGRVQYTPDNAVISGIEVPKKFIKRILREHTDLEEVINNRNFYLRGRTTRNGIKWFGLTTDEFRQIDPYEVDEHFSEFSMHSTIRYDRNRERFLANYRVDVLGNGELVYIVLDSGNFGVYGGNGMGALRVGVSVYEVSCTNWTLFLKNKSILHRVTKKPLDLSGKVQKLVGEVKNKWEKSRKIYLTKEEALEYAKEHLNVDFSGDLTEDKISVYELAWNITKYAQNFGGSSRTRKEMLAGQLVLNGN